MFVLLFAYVFGGAIAVQGGNYREYIIGGSSCSRWRSASPARDRDHDRSQRRGHRQIPIASGDAHGVSRRPLLAELAGMVLSIVILLTAVRSSAGVHSDFLHVATALVLLLTFASR
jgi:hypothetical protein